MLGLQDTHARSSPPLSPFPLYDLVLRSSSLGNASSVNASAILAGQQSRTISLLATSTSFVSILAALCAAYWFYMIRRSFRRDLVALLIAANSYKSLWLLVQSLVSMTEGGLKTQSSFCQAGGYMLQISSETCDVAICLMSLHMHLQMFPSKRFPKLRHDGLYHVRRWVYAFAFIVPNVMASLAFVHSGQGYVASGPLCNLPIRPFWYRLALSWIPRYLIMIYICYVAVRIYCHVGKEFKVFGQEDDESRSRDLSAVSQPSRTKIDNAMAAGPPSATVDDGEKRSSIDAGNTTPDDVIVPSRRLTVPTLHSAPKPRSRTTETPKGISKPDSTGSLPGSRRPSAPTTWSDFSAFQGHSTKTTHYPRKGSHQTIGPVAISSIGTDPDSTPLDRLTHPRGSVTTLGSVPSSEPQSRDLESRALPIVTESPKSARVDLNAPNRATAMLVQDRRRAIQRQLRLLFIYPVAYILINIFPFTAHCISYSDYYAQHPVFSITALSIFCQSFRGFVDVAIFSWREKPWRHIPGSDGTLLGSFLFWRFGKAVDGAKSLPDPPRTPSTPHVRSSDEIEKPPSQSGLLGSLKRWSASLASLPASSPRHSHFVSSPTTPTASPRTRIVLHHRTCSGGSDGRHLASEQAHERLALERMQHQLDRRSLQHRRRESTVSSPVTATRQGSHPGPIKREWWDAGGTEDLFDDSDDAVEEDKKHVGS